MPQDDDVRPCSAAFLQPFVESVSLQINGNEGEACASQGPGAPGRAQANGPGRARARPNGPGRARHGQAGRPASKKDSSNASTLFLGGGVWGEGGRFTYLIFYLGISGRRNKDF